MIMIFGSEVLVSITSYDALPGLPSLPTPQEDAEHKSMNHNSMWKARENERRRASDSGGQLVVTLVHGDLLVLTGPDFEVRFLDRSY